MLGEHHNLVTDFPKYKDRIHELKMKDAHFARLFDEYNDLDKAIIRIEEGIETPSDEYTEELKKKRLFLKDQLFAMFSK